MASGLRGAPELVERKEEWDQEVMSALDREVTRYRTLRWGRSFCGVLPAAINLQASLENRPLCP